VAQRTATHSFVLVVDDDLDVRNSIVEVLRVGGHHAVEAQGDDHAVGLLTEGRVALLLLDLGFPTGKGLEMLDRIGNPPPVILMSGSGKVPVVDPRVSVFLSKPMRPEQLLEQVALCLE
jgi:CheY-like chemotaxis protein